MSGAAQPRVGEALHPVGHVGVTDVPDYVVVTSLTPAGAGRHPLEAVDAAPQVVQLVVVALELWRLLAACERGDRRLADVLGYTDLVALADLGLFAKPLRPSGRW